MGRENGEKGVRANVKDMIERQNKKYLEKHLDKIVIKSGRNAALDKNGCCAAWLI